MPPRFLTKQARKAQQEKVYELARSYTAEHGKPPSVRYLGEMLDLSHVTVARHLDELEQKGRIARTIHGRITREMTFPEDQ